MPFSYSSGVITQTGTDVSLSGLSGLTGVSVVLGGADGVDTYFILASVTSLIINGDLTHDPDYECLVMSDSSRMIVGGIYTYGVQKTIEGKVRNSIGTGLIINRKTTQSVNTVAASVQFLTGSQFYTFGGEIKSAGCWFFGTTTNVATNNIIIQPDGGTRFININRDNGLHLPRIFALSSGVLIKSAFFGGMSNGLILFSTAGFDELSADMDFASFTPDANGVKPPVTVTDAVLINNKATQDYLYQVAGGLASNINKYIFLNPDTGSLIRTAPTSSTTNKMGVVEIKRNIEFTSKNLSNQRVKSVLYTKFAGASQNPVGRYEGIDDYITPRVHILETTDINQAVDTVLYAVAQGYTTEKNLPLDMDSLTTNNDDVQIFSFLSYGNQYFSQQIPLRGIGTLNYEAVLFADENVTLSEEEAGLLSNIVTLDNFYDLAKYWKTRPIQGQLEYPTIFLQPVTANGVNLNVGNLSIIINSTGDAFTINTTSHIISINSSELTSGAKFSSLQSNGGFTINEGVIPTNVRLVGNVAQDVPTNLDGVEITGTLTYNTDLDISISFTNCQIGAIVNNGIGTVTITQINSTVGDYSDPEINFLDSTLTFTGAVVGDVVRVRRVDNSLIVLSKNIVNGNILFFKAGDLVGVEVYFERASATGATIVSTFTTETRVISIGDNGSYELIDPASVASLAGVKSYFDTYGGDVVWRYKTREDRTVTVDSGTSAQNDVFVATEPGVIAVTALPSSYVWTFVVRNPNTGQVEESQAEVFAQIKRGAATIAATMNVSFDINNSRTNARLQDSLTLQLGDVVSVYAYMEFDEVGYTSPTLNSTVVNTDGSVTIQNILSAIELSDIIAKEATSEAIKAKTDILVNTDLSGIALEATSQEIKTAINGISVEGGATLQQIEQSTVLAKEATSQSILTGLGNINVDLTGVALESTSQQILEGLNNIEVDKEAIAAEVWEQQPERLKEVSTVQTTGDQISTI